MVDSSGTVPEWLAKLLEWLYENICKPAKENKEKGRRKYDVPLFSQGSLSMCGAYCEVMINSYHELDEIDQATADRLVKIIGLIKNGANWNAPVWPGNIGERIHRSEITDIWVIYDALEEGPIYAIYDRPPDWTGESKAGHMVVVTGVDCSAGLVYTNNPWGIQAAQTFDEFLHHFTNGSDNWILGGIYPVEGIK